MAAIVRTMTAIGSAITAIVSALHAIVRAMHAILRAIVQMACALAPAVPAMRAIVNAMPQWPQCAMQCTPISGVLTPSGKFKQPVGGGVAKRTYLGLESEMKRIDCKRFSWKTSKMASCEMS